ncbi:hypothetical protein [Reyranella sp.]
MMPLLVAMLSNAFHRLALLGGAQPVLDLADMLHARLVRVLLRRSRR